MKRMFNEDEMSVSRNSLIRLNEEIKAFDYARRYSQLVLDAGLEVNYQKQKKEHEQKVRDATQAIEHNQQVIETLIDQMTNGVEPKEPETSLTPEQEAEILKIQSQDTEDA